MRVAGGYSGAVFSAFTMVREVKDVAIFWGPDARIAPRRAPQTASKTRWWFLAFICPCRVRDLRRNYLPGFRPANGTEGSQRGGPPERLARPVNGRRHGQRRSPGGRV